MTCPRRPAEARPQALGERPPPRARRSLKLPGRRRGERGIEAASEEGCNGSRRVPPQGDTACLPLGRPERNGRRQCTAALHPLAAGARGARATPVRNRQPEAAPPMPAPRRRATPAKRVFVHCCVRLCSTVQRVRAVQYSARTVHCSVCTREYSVRTIQYSVCIVQHSVCAQYSTAFVPYATTFCKYSTAFVHSVRTVQYSARTAQDCVRTVQYIVLVHRSTARLAVRYSVRGVQRSVCTVQYNVRTAPHSICRNHIAVTSDGPSKTNKHKFASAMFRGSIRKSVCFSCRDPVSARFSLGSAKTEFGSG